MINNSNNRPKNDSLLNKRKRFFQMVADFIIQLRKENIEMIPICFYRSPEEQKQLFLKGKSKTLNSRHSVWLAIDLVLYKDGRLEWKRTPEYERAGAIWKSLGGRWGGDWIELNDIYHFEYSL